MKVILTGASGFIGRHVLLRAPADWEIVATFRHSTSLEDFVKSHRLDCVQTVCCDLTQREDVTRLASLVGGHADAMLFLAANGDPAAAAARPRWDLESNAVALVNVFEQCSADHVVFVSSGAVYDGAVGAVTPATPVAPRLPYAISKLAAEQYVRFFAERRRTIGTYANVRFFGAYGPYEPERKITTRWILAAMRGEHELRIRGDGRNLIDFMHVDDAVDGLIALTRAREFNGTLDFGGGAPQTVDAVVEAMRRVVGGGMAIRHDGRTEEYIQFRTVDETMRLQLGIVPSISFAEGFERLYTTLQGSAAPAAHSPRHAG